MTATMNPNGQTRKTLASQLDRLDSILDTLDQGLQEAVATAVQEAVSVAVREAIKGLLTEVLTNPDILDQLRAVMISPMPRKTSKASSNFVSLKEALKERWGKVWSGIKARLQAAKQGCGTTLRRIGQWTGKLLSHCRVLGQFKRPILLSSGIGLVAAVGAYFAGPYVAAAAGWLGGFATTLGLQAVVAFKRLKDAVVSET